MLSNSSEFLKAVDFVLKEEVGPFISSGGYISPDRARRLGDPGGETKFGIAKNTYPNLDIASLTRDDAVDIYFLDYWQTNPARETNQRSHCDDFKWPLSFVHHDAVVNIGNRKIARDGTVVWHWEATRILQRAAGVDPDGYFGAQTASAVDILDPTDLAIKCILERNRYYKSRGRWADRFQAGWRNRTDRLIAAIGASPSA